MLRKAICGVTFLIGLVFAWVNAPAWAGPPLIFPENRWHIALDPGHGGDDTGARGPTGLLEKAVCLELARTLALRLESRYRVTLTRSDDYHVQLRQRAAIANQAQANLYIGLHTAASFMHAARGAMIYHHAPLEKASDRQVEAGAVPPKPQDWHLVQSRHHAGSQNLANILKSHLEKQLGFAQIPVRGAPLAQLEGVDMPAILIEVGHITNPNMEQQMASFQGVTALAQAIEKGIDDYIQSQASDPRP